MTSVSLLVTLLVMLCSPESFHPAASFRFGLPKDSMNRSVCLSLLLAEHNAIKGSHVSDMDPPLHLCGCVITLKNTLLTHLRKAKAVQNTEQIVHRSYFPASVWSKEK